MTEFGDLKVLDPRVAWPNEASDFTPWLAENLGVLGEAIGLELELQDREAPVGEFSLDLLAREVGSNRTVVIENQLQPTDHDHLGKLLTYAGGLDAQIVVWLARELRDEHRQALEWLNRHTDDETNFFVVTVRILQIDSSRYAYDFNAVVTPNEWQRQAIVRPPSARREAYREYFQALIDELREVHRFTGARAAQPQSWYFFASGRTRISYGANFDSKGRVQANLYIDPGDKPENEALFNDLAKDKDQIEREFGESLTWELLPDARACRISISRPGTIGMSANELAELRKWQIDMLLRFKRVFDPRLP